MGDEQLTTLSHAGLAMHGIVHVPSTPRRERDAVVLFHGGRQARRGPHCLYVKVARALADAGFFVLRYENRGYGDSEGPERMTFNHWVEDAKLWTRFFRDEWELSRLWGWGLCGGAILASHCEADRRGAFSGFVFLNPLFDENYVSADGTLWAPAGPIHGALRRLRRAARPISFWRSFDESVVDHIADFPALLAELSVPTLFLFGDSAPHVQNYREKLFGHPSWRGREVPAESIDVPNGDHNFAGLEQERVVIDETVRWLVDRRSRAERGERHRRTGAVHPLDSASRAS